jgi:PHP family Zn ribbon phosphoesterase
MVPTLIVHKACQRGLDIIAITDHNSVSNVEAVMQAAEGTGLKVLPGMELETREEVHLLTLFENAWQAHKWQEIVYDHLPRLPNDEDLLGAQLVVSAENALLLCEERRLLVASTLSLDEAVGLVSELGGFCIPAHVDRPIYSVLASLGFIPPEIDIPAVEVSRHVEPAEASESITGIGERTIIQSSDAHYLVDLGAAKTCFQLEEPVLKELVLACRGMAGRRVLWGEEPAADPRINRS